MPAINLTNNNDVWIAPGLYSLPLEVHGLDGHDIIVGGKGNDHIFGNDGDDGLHGGSGTGDDWLTGGNGADSLNGGDGVDDVALYDDSGAGVTVNLAAGTGSGGTAQGDTLANIEHVTGSAFDDTLIGNDIENDLVGGSGNDSLDGGGAQDYLVGGDGSDVLYGREGDDTLAGGNQDDMLKGGGGADTLIGGPGTDTASYFWAPESVSVSLASGGSAGEAQGDTLFSVENLFGSAYDDVLYGNTGANVLHGMNGHDDLFGNDGGDTLYGDSGNDTLTGWTGADTMIGGLGDDHYDVDNVFDSITELTGEGNDTVATEGSYMLPAGADIESLQPRILTGTAAINLTGNAGGNQILGNDGNNLIDGRGGADQMSGRAGEDIYYVDNANDTVTEWGGEGADEVRASVSWTLTQGAWVETLRTTNDAGTTAINLIGNSFPNLIIGNNGVNVINGGPADDQMVGLGGGDIYYVDHAGDSVTESGGEGIDIVRASVSWTLTPGADVETLHTTADAGMLAINLTGNETGNTLRGNNGNNILNGGDGNDELTGLWGEDAFLFDTPLDAVLNMDYIMDFNVNDDTIQLDQTIFSSSLTPGSSVGGSQFVIGTAALDAAHRIIYDEATGDVFYDSDGTGATAAIRFAHVSAGLALTNFDFFVV